MAEPREKSSRVAAGWLLDVVVWAMALAGAGCFWWGLEGNARLAAWIVAPLPAAWIGALPARFCAPRSRWLLAAILIGSAASAVWGDWRLAAAELRDQLQQAAQAGRQSADHARMLAKIAELENAGKSAPSKDSGTNTQDSVPPTKLENRSGERAADSAALPNPAGERQIVFRLYRDRLANRWWQLALGVAFSCFAAVQASRLARPDRPADNTQPTE